VTSVSGDTRSAARHDAEPIRSASLSAIQEGLRGVVRIPGGTANSLNSRNFPIAVMGKTGTTSDFRDALFVGSTYGVNGITVAVWIGFDDNRPLGRKETGGRNALPIFREIMLRVYDEKLVGKAPKFPRAIEAGIDAYLVARAERETSRAETLAFDEVRSGISLSEVAARSFQLGRVAPAVVISETPDQ
jgi:membrane carboxypeptidase/penicillin-binding protein